MVMKYGLQLPQGMWMLSGSKDPVEAYERITHVAQTAEECGYDTLWLADHFMPTVHQPSRQEEDRLFECWTTLSAVARDTQRVRLAQAVTCNGYRNPALLAKMASTVDVLSHGRLTLGIGAGDFEQEFRAYGYACPKPPERLRQLREAIQIILAMWTQDEATFEGEYYQIHGAINQPKGVQQPHIPLLIAGEGEKVTLKLVAQYADACHLISPDPAVLEHKFAVLKAHCETLGRDYEHIRRTLTLACAIGDTAEQALAKLPEAQKAHLAVTRTWLRSSDSAQMAADRSLVQGAESLVAGDSSAAAAMGLIGSPKTIRERLAAYEAAGVQELRLHFLDGVQPESVRRFASEFIA